MPQHEDDTSTGQQHHKGRRKNAAPKRSTTKFTHARKLPLVHCTADNQFFRYTHDIDFDDLVAEPIDESEADRIIRQQHPPLIVRIRHRPDKRIVHLWDVRNNRYDGGRTVDADDPIVTGN